MSEIRRYRSACCWLTPAMVGVFAPYLALFGRLGVEARHRPDSQSASGGPLTTKSFMLITMELTHGRSRNKLVHILVGFSLSGSGAKHGNYESNALLVGLESTPGPAGLAIPICSFRAALPITKAPLRLFPVRGPSSESS